MAVYEGDYIKKKEKKAPFKGNKNALSSVESRLVGDEF